MEYLHALISFLLLSLVPSASAARETSNFIDTVSGYGSLSRCARQALSTIVRAQMSGCGDNEQLTSYTCFCTDSSSFFSDLIAQDVATSCGNQNGQLQAQSAGQVFDGYCALGVEPGPATTTATANGPLATGTASPASGVSGTLPSSTSGSHAAQQTTDSTDDDDSSSNSTAIIAAGIGVPLIVISIGLVGLFLWRRNRHQKQRQQQRGPYELGGAGTQQPPPRPHRPSEKYGGSYLSASTYSHSQYSPAPTWKSAPSEYQELDGRSPVYAEKHTGHRFEEPRYPPHPQYPPYPQYPEDAYRRHGPSELAGRGSPVRPVELDSNEMMANRMLAELTAEEHARDGF